MIRYVYYMSIFPPNLQLISSLILAQETGSLSHRFSCQIHQDWLWNEDWNAIIVFFFFMGLGLIGFKSLQSWAAYRRLQRSLSWTARSRRREKLRRRKRLQSDVIYGCKSGAKVCIDQVLLTLPALPSQFLVGDTSEITCINILVVCNGNMWMNHLKNTKYHT